MYEIIYSRDVLFSRVNFSFSVAREKSTTGRGIIVSAGGFSHYNIFIYLINFSWHSRHTCEAFFQCRSLS